MSKKVRREDVIWLHEWCMEIPESFRQDMRVPARAFITRELFDALAEDRSLEQLVTIATLPGIQKAAFAMPDMHQGYGFPIGGVAGMAIDEGGVISPGGIGYDINCGVRLLVADADYVTLKPYLKALADGLYRAVPSGAGPGGGHVLVMHELDEILRHGAQALVEKGFGTQDDLDRCEEGGCMAFARPDLISKQAKMRGHDQLGTLGSGNHFLEVQRVEEVYDTATAQAFGLRVGQVTVMIHCGSRGLGHQTCADNVAIMNQYMADRGCLPPDRELAYAPFLSPEGQQYYYAMAAAANFAWANRHMIAVRARQVFARIAQGVNLSMVYDVSHNIGKVETHVVGGKEKRLIMHRKGATRSFAPGRIEVPEVYRSVGQPVLIPGTMGTSSYVLAGIHQGMEVAFGSCCHGAGRNMSRAQAKRTVQGAELRKELAARAIIVCCDSNAELAEEAPQAYKDVDEVVAVVEHARIAKKVARLVPLAVIKGD